MDEINYNEMVRKFNKQIKYAESFSDDGLLEILIELKSNFIDLYGDN